MTQYPHPAKSVIVFAGTRPLWKITKPKTCQKSEPGDCARERWTVARVPLAESPLWRSPYSKAASTGETRSFGTHYSAAHFCFTIPASFILVKHGCQEQSIKNRESIP